MKQYGLAFLAASAILSSCTGSESTQSTAPKEAVQANATVQSYDPVVTTVKYEELLKVLDSKSDTLYVVNFWATWCLPCVKELPYFVSTAKAMADKPMQLILVSLDTKDELETKVIPFLKSKQFIATHYLLDDNGRMNEWIPKFDTDWDGAIPATALYKNGKKLRFTSGQLSEQELREQINTYLTQ